MAAFVNREFSNFTGESREYRETRTIPNLHFCQKINTSKFSKIAVNFFNHIFWKLEFWPSNVGAKIQIQSKSKVLLKLNFWTKIRRPVVLLRNWITAKIFVSAVSYRRQLCPTYPYRAFDINKNRVVSAKIVKMTIRQRENVSTKSNMNGKTNDKASGPFKGRFNPK